MTGMRFNLCAIAMVIISAPLHSQSKEKLESERKKLIKEIEKTSQYLEKTSLSKKSTLKDLKAIETQVDSRKKLITNIREDISESDKTLKDNTETLEVLNKKMFELTDQYGGILRYNYLQHLSNTKWSYILSSTNLNNMVLRWRYMRQFEEYANTKKDEIVALNAEINASNQVITKTIEERKDLLKTEEGHKIKLEKEMSQKNKTLKEITGKEAELRKELNKKKAEREKLNASIESIILAELKRVKVKEVESPALNTASDKLTTEFSTNKGRLPWPMASGFVSAKFGTIPHPTIKNINIENNGIDITTKGNQTVKSVFGGEVVGITKVPGSKHMIIIRHGNFYSVYSNVENVSVRKGEKISVQQAIGTASPDEDGQTELHFELWRDRTKLNPESWLK